MPDQLSPDTPPPPAPIPPHLAAHAFKPGQSGNPGGRPKGRTVSAILLEVLGRDAGKGNGRTVADVLAEVIVKEALGGDFRFAKEVLERTEGKVTDKVEHTGEGGSPIAHSLDLGRLSVGELDAFERIFARAAGERPGGDA